MNEAHNEPLQLAIEGGIPAVLLFALFGWWWLAAVGRILSRGRRSQPIAQACAAATAILMLASLVDYPLRTPLLGSVFAIACILLWRATRGDDMPAADLH